MSQWSYEEAVACGLKLSDRLKPNHGFPRPMEAIIDYVLEHLRMTRGNKHIPINFHPRIYEGKTFYGTIEDSEVKVDIYYDLNRNRCWRRFIVTKELCHLIYASSDNLHLSSSVEEIDSLLSQIFAGLVMDQAASSEQAAILMAIEVLLPHSERPNIDKMIKDGRDAKDIAKYYLLPAQMVSSYLHGNYADLVEKMAKRLASDARR